MLDGWALVEYDCSQLVLLPALTALRVERELLVDVHRVLDLLRRVGHLVVHDSLDHEDEHSEKVVDG